MAESQKKASIRYTGEGGSPEEKAAAKVESVRVRVPKGWLDKIKAHVSESDNYRSVNDMICQLVKKEIPGIDENE